MRPTFSIVTPVYNTPTGALREMISSVVGQTYPDWELILVDDHSPKASVRDVLRAAADQDARVKVIERPENGHIVRASNDGLAAARGDFVVLLDHDDLLTTDALAENARAIASEPDADVLYSDEDRLMPDGKHRHLFTKPDWSPWRLRSQNYLGHLAVIRTELLREVGGFREGFEGSQDHDLMFRVTEHARRVVHIPKVLYHWRVIPGSVADRLDAKPYATTAAMRAIGEHLERVGIGGKVSVVRPGLYEVATPVPEASVSLVVLLAEITPDRLRDAHRTVSRALDSARRQLREVVVVHPEDLDRRAFERPFENDRVKLPVSTRYVPWSATESAMAGAVRAIEDTVGDHVVVLDSSVHPAGAHWLPALLTPLSDEKVALSSGLVLSARRGVAYAGLVGHKARWTYPLRGFSVRAEGPFGALRLIREVDAVDGTCVALRRADVPSLLPGVADSRATDLGLALSEAAATLGRSVVWTGHSRFHCSDFPDTDLRSPSPVGEVAHRYPLVEDVDGWIPAGDRLLRLYAPSMLPAWRRFKRRQRKMKRGTQRVKGRLRPTRGRRLGSQPLNDPTSD